MSSATVSLSSRCEMQHGSAQDRSGLFSVIQTTYTVAHA